VERPVTGAEEGHELVVDDLHDLLAGRQALEDLGPDVLLADAGDEVLDDLEVDVRLEEGQPHLAHRRVDVGLGHPAPAGEVGEGRAEAIAQGVEHDGSATPWPVGPVVMRPFGDEPNGWCADSGDTEVAAVYRKNVTEPGIR
jgi:hypothetical protein